MIVTGKIMSAQQLSVIFIVVSDLFIACAVLAWCSLHYHKHLSSHRQVFVACCHCPLDPVLFEYNLHFFFISKPLHTG